MFLKLSVLTRDGQFVAGIDDCCQVNIYQFEGDAWNVTSNFQWQIGELSGMIHVRTGIQDLIERLGDCRVIIGRKITGMPYYIFDRKGFHIFEADSPVSSELLDAIQRELNHAATERKEQDSDVQKIHKTPYSLNNDGIYYLNLIELQQAFPDISSKKALRQFLLETSFSELHLVCSHIPPWLNDIALARGMQIVHSDQDDNACRINIIIKGVAS